MTDSKLYGEIFLKLMSEGIVGDCEKSIVTVCLLCGNFVDVVYIEKCEIVKTHRFEMQHGYVMHTFSPKMMDKLFIFGGIYRSKTEITLQELINMKSKLSESKIDEVIDVLEKHIEVAKEQFYEKRGVSDAT